jgi:hypothetical protein
VSAGHPGGHSTDWSRQSAFRCHDRHRAAFTRITSCSGVCVFGVQGTCQGNRAGRAPRV